MKKNTKELEVDFIGGQGSLTAMEEKALSEFFLKRTTSVKKSSSIKKSRKIKRTKTAE